ncbi:hypothetical protein ONZ45_g13293 [Pleurotus djamor]|nr:hypothetical protein ONZ45_g13293 [Pleurotus djamor]
MNPRVLKTSGFKHLDRVINICAQHGIYTILDMHTAPGGQNTDWHCDSGTHQAAFWIHKDFQDRLIWLWEELAKHYAGNKWIAGYNPLNEPTDSTHTRLVEWYNRVYKAIRAHDPDHTIFFDGNTFASDFSHFGDAHKNWENTAYSIHDYSTFGFPSATVPYTGTAEQKRRLKRSYEKKREWMDQRGLCVWNGEWGPVYARKQYEGEATDSINEVRYHVLKDQLDIYNQDRLSWSIWLYKDIGFQGMVYTSTETPYMQLFADFLAKKHRLAVDAWGADEQYVQKVYQPLIDHVIKEVPERFRNLYPYPVWTLGSRVGRLSRNLLVSEFLIKEWAEHFVGKTEEELVEIAASFKFENCVHRDGLNKVLTENASAAKKPPLEFVHFLVETIAEVVDSELKLPKRSSLIVVILGNCLLQLSFFSIVSSASAYSEHLGGTATFSGLVIGIPTLFSGIALIPMTRMDKGTYSVPLTISYVSMCLGAILYALAYPANFLYLILIGRIVSGFGFTAFMYSKRYCSDPRIVGVRRRTMLASWLVIGAGFGFSAGPFFSGLLYKIGFHNGVFNGYTSPGWLMAIIWAIFGVIAHFVFEDVHGSVQSQPATALNPIPVQPDHPVNPPSEQRRPTRNQWGAIVAMCWYAMTCFFILGAWEANIPVFAAARFGFSPYASGNLIALGGVTALPFLILNVIYARRFQDRSVLALGSFIGLIGLLIMLATLHVDHVTPASVYVCWFLVALGFNLATTCTLSLLSKQLPPSWNGWTSMAIQYSNYTGRVTGAVWGGAGVRVGMMNFIGLQIAIVGIGKLLHFTLWKQLKAKTG